MRLSMPRTRAVAVGLVALTALTYSAPPASAGERVASARPSSSLAARAAASVANLKPTPRALAQAAGTPSASTDNSRPFLKTPMGIAAVLLMAAGASYVAISIGRDNKKVHSPIR